MFSGIRNDGGVIAFVRGFAMVASALFAVRGVSEMTVRDETAIMERHRSSPSKVL